MRITHFLLGFDRSFASPVSITDFALMFGTFGPVIALATFASV
jgi:hypothetical protein